MDNGQADVEQILARYRNPGVNVDLGCGDDKEPGFLGIDIRPLPEVDIVWDLEVYPWPLPDECASLVTCSHLVEHINPHRGGFLRFMDEAWRILMPYGKMMISTPYAGSTGYWGDPTHVNGCTEITFGYFDPTHPRARSAEGIRLWDIYKPQPWKIVNNAWDISGNLEVALQKILLHDVEDPERSTSMRKLTGI